MRDEILDSVEPIDIEAERYELREPGKYCFEHDRRGFVQAQDRD